MSAAPAIWTTTRTGTAFNLLAPSEKDVDLRNHIAPVLATLPRFAGSCLPGRRGEQWTVIDHLLLGCSYLFSRSKSPALCLYWLLHDAHEAYIGDITTPVASALGYRLTQRLHMGSVVFAETLDDLKRDIDAAIYAALGIRRPTEAEAEQIWLWDLRMLMTERRDLLAPVDRPWGQLENVPTIRTKGQLRPLKGGPEVKAIAYVKAIETHLPFVRRAPAAEASFPQPHPPAAIAAQ